MSRVEEGGDRKPVTEVRVARIKAFQAIAVALITGVIGLATGYFASGGGGKSVIGSESQPQHWLVVDKIEANRTPKVRLIVTVDGVNYSYPSKAIWAEIGPGMSSEKFPLVYSEDGYDIQFSAFVSGGPGEDRLQRLMSQELRSVELAQLPLESQWYDLNPIQGATRTASQTMRIKFSIK